jgi:hypothetical protein
MQRSSLFSMSAGTAELDDPVAMLEDYRATVTELRGNVERLKELVEEQILLETPPRFRRGQLSRSRRSFRPGQAD